MFTSTGVFRNSFTSGGKKVSTAQQEIFFTMHEKGKQVYKPVHFLEFETFEQPCEFKINDEDTVHWLDANKKITFQNLAIHKLTILTDGVEFYFTAFTEK